MTRLALLVLLGGFAALAGCATTVPPSPPPPVIQTREVRVPVPVPCVASVPPKPVYDDDVVSLDADIFTLSRAVLVGRKQREAHKRELEGAMAACPRTEP